MYKAKPAVAPGMPDFVRLIIAALVGAALALGGQWVLVRPSGTATALVNGTLNSTAANTGALDLSSTGVSEALSDLRSNQQRLQGELAMLRDKITQAAIEVPQLSAAAEEIPSSSQGRAVNAALTVKRLTENGLAQDEADALIQRLDELALARLDVDYRIRQAADDRERSLVAREERRRIPRDTAAIREEFGDTAYDSYLYASGQPNRVEVASVLRSSAAVSVGVQSGDVLRSLNGKPLFSVRDLTAQVRAGAPDQTYALSLERDGQVMEVWVPGGPLGVRVTGRSEKPDS